MRTARHALTDEPLLTVQEETELALQIEAGVLAADARAGSRSRLGASEVELLLLEERGERARQRYIRANLRLVAKIARQSAARTGLPETDLFQEGCLGLMAAVQRFDCRRGYKFSTYASFWVRAYVGAATANSLGALNVPASRGLQLRAARGVEGTLTQSQGRLATVAEVAAGLGRSEKWTADLLSHQLAQSFDALEAEVRDASAGPEAWDEARVQHDRPGAELLWHVHGLEREVLALRFGFVDGSTHSYAEVGRLLTITVSKARRVERRALEVLRSVCPSGAAAQL